MNIYETAHRKAQHGRREWLVWRGRDGELQAAPKTRTSLKAALLAAGTGGHFTLADGRFLHRIRWREGILMWRNAGPSK